MSDDQEQPLASPDDPNAATPAVPSTINMPDHWIRQNAWYQGYVRLARPTLDWVTVAAVGWAMIIQPRFEHKFDPIEAGMALAWAGAVYGIKMAEKIKGVA